MQTYKVLIEIPEGSANKYEYDEESGKFVLDFVFHSGLKFPFNYGHIPNTRTEDGDAVDVAVFSSEPILQGTVVEIKPIGMLKMKDRNEQDNKIIAVPVIDPLAEKMNSLSDFSGDAQKKFVDFYLQVGVQKKKKIEPEGFAGPEEAAEEIEKSKI